MKRDPINIALWRFEKISAFLDKRLTKGERSRMINEASRIPVIWPNADEGPIPRSTLYRWLKMYNRNPVIESLMPQKKSQPQKEKVIREEWVNYALALLEEESDRSLFVLCGRIKRKFNLKFEISKSSLHRAIQNEPRYLALRRRAEDKGSKGRLRKRFQALKTHEIWHGDAIGPFNVFFADGRKAKYHILSILDDATRFILAALVVLTENIASVISVFRKAAARYGLCFKWYADRGSAYDSNVFRKGIGILGVHRIRTKARNASAHGKIEAYHRSLRRWFIKELKHQLVLDEQHLQGLLDAVIDRLYHEHHHRELNMSPRQAFVGSISDRRVSIERLRDAFLIEKMLKPHKKTGELRVGKGTPLFRVPIKHLAPRVCVAIDPATPDIAYIKCNSGTLLPLSPAIKPAGKPKTEKRREPVGSLTPLLDEYRGRSLPQARPGFGLPEIYEKFSSALNRPVPVTEQEAMSVIDWLERCGPFDPDAFYAALDQTINRIGSGRPLSQILTALEAQVKRGAK
jgi:transposase InsO family protein